MSRLKELWAVLKARYQTWPRAVQLAAMGLLLGVCALVINAWVVRLYTYRTDTVTDIEIERDRVAQLQAYVARAKDVEHEREMLVKRLEGLKDRLVPGDTGTLAAAHLQDHVNTIARETGAVVQSAQVMREEEAGVYRQVTVRLTLRATVKALADFLEALEYGSMQLAIPYLQIDRRAGGNVLRRAQVKARAKGQAIEEDRMLSATIEVRGLAAGEDPVPGIAVEPVGAEGPEDPETPQEGTPKEPEAPKEAAVPKEPAMPKEPGTPDGSAKPEEPGQPKGPAGSAEPREPEES
jgi:hypothetical protein